MRTLLPETRHARRLVRTIIVLALGALVALSLTSSPLAAPSQKTKPTKCGNKVLNDWWDNGRVDRLYKLNCYEEAIDAIPIDIRDYSDAEEVINRALQAAVSGKVDRKGGKDPSPEDDKGIQKPEDREPSAPVDPTGDRGNGDPTATPDVGEGTSSVPIPLIVLGGMSLALLAAGGLGYLSRRRQAAVDADGNPLDPLV